MPLPAPPEPIEARLLDVARAHVRKFGAARTTIVGIAAEAGMTHANVYRYFPSKAELFEEITASWLRPLEARLREAADGAIPLTTSWSACCWRSIAPIGKGSRATGASSTS